MNHSCSQCSFTAKFESALTMHHQLHHENGEPAVDEFPTLDLPEKSNTIPRTAGTFSRLSPPTVNKGMSLLPRTGSATKILGRLRARICKSKTLFAHPEEPGGDISAASDRSSKAVKSEFASRGSLNAIASAVTKETYACHLCDFDADRITALDRHLLNDHKIGLDSLLQLVLAKTKDSLAEDDPATEFFGIRTPYYRADKDVTEEGEYVIETVAPKIKILKHVAVNTDLLWSDIPDLKDNCRQLTSQLNKLMEIPIEKCEKQDLLEKMNTLNEYMCKFVDSSNTLKKVLYNKYDGKHKSRDTMSGEPIFDLRLGDNETPRDWERSRSENLERNRSKSRGEKSKFSAESYYF